ncbi:hypothetical protein MJO29_014747 [Puccinia striiformis f. sp. tritici]|nr:hypothetical protein MJO29_014747 [Puccinia striiformis f. sp. tritici]
MEETDQADQSFDSCPDHQPIRIDTPPPTAPQVESESPRRVNPEPETHKRRRLNSPDPVAQAAIIDAELARVLWNTGHTLQDKVYKRPRCSDQSFTQTPACPADTSTSSSSYMPSKKKARETSPQPETGTKRFQDALESSPTNIPNSHQHDQKRAKQDITSASTRPKHTPAFTSRPKAAVPKPNLAADPSSSSSPNFILSSEIRTKYATQVEQAEKHRKVGTTYYTRQEYQQALLSYTQAISLYPPPLFPNQPRHSGHLCTLANRASTCMALGQYEHASKDLEESLAPIDLLPATDDERANLYKRIFRLIRCHLALLNITKAEETCKIITDPNSSVKILSNDSQFGQFHSLMSKTHFLVGIQQEIDSARDQKRWRVVLTTIGILEREIVGWGFKFDINTLPGPWTIWKAETMARLGQPVEAGKVLHAYTMPLSMKCECAVAYALVALAKGDLGIAHKRFSEILRTQPNYEPASRWLAFLKPLISVMEKIERTASQNNHLGAINQCDAFLVNLKDSLLTTLRIKVETVKCEQLSKQSLKDTSTGIQYCQRLLLANASLLKQMNFTSSTNVMTKRDVYEPYRVYLIRALLAQARSTYHFNHYQFDWKTIYLTIFDLIRCWPTLSLPLRDTILQEIHTRITFNRSNNNNTNNHNNQHSHNNQYSHHNYHSRNHQRSSRSTHNNPSSHHSNSDPKGYYKTLGLQKNATAAEIKKAFRTLSLAHHPDKGGETALFQTINQAHSILSNPDTKSTYDLTGR